MLHQSLSSTKKNGGLFVLFILSVALVLILTGFCESHALAQQPTLEELISIAIGPDGAAQKNALKELILIAKGAGGEDVAARTLAIEALGSVGGQKAVSTLSAILKNAKSGLRREAAEALTKIGDKNAIKVLVSAVASKDTELQVLAAQALGNIGSESSVDALIKVLKGKNQEVILATIASLGKIGGDKATKALITALNKQISYRSSGDATLIEGLAQALGMIGNDDAISMLSSMLLEDINLYRWPAARAIAKNGDARVAKDMLFAVEYLFDDLPPSVIEYFAKQSLDIALDPLVSALNGQEPDIQELAWRALEDLLGIPPAQIESSDAIGSNQSDQAEMASILAGSGDERFVEPIITVLSSESIKARKGAVQALGMLGGERAIQALAAAVKDPEIEVRQMVVAYFSGIQSDTAIKVLAEAANDSDTYVASSAIEGLWGIGNDAAIDTLVSILSDTKYESISSDILRYCQTDNPRASEVLIALCERYDYWPYMVKLIAAEMAHISDERAVQWFEKGLEDKENYAIVSGAYSYFIRLGREGSESILINALNVDGDVAMAEAYLNCGNSKLEAAATHWADENGYTVISLTGTQGSHKWGSGIGK